MSHPADTSDASLRKWLYTNGVTATNTSDAFFQKDPALMKSLYTTRPWNKDIHYVQRVYISSIALLKILIHAQTGRQGGGKAGGSAAAAAAAGGGGASTTSAGGFASPTREEWLEVMGMMQGHFSDNTIVITDSFAVPVPATAVECVADERTINYMVEYNTNTERLGKCDKVFGWYHTHPSYSCFLSGTDVHTQRMQQLSGPIVAVVVDPVSTLATGKVDLKAFRTYPEAYMTANNNTLSPNDRAVRDQIDQSVQKKELLSGGGSSYNVLLSTAVDNAIASANAAAARDSNNHSAGGASSGGAGRSKGSGNKDSADNKARTAAHHAHCYYEVPVTIYRSEGDATVLAALWRRFWAAAFTANPHIDNALFVNKQLDAFVTCVSGGRFGGGGGASNNTEGGGATAAGGGGGGGGVSAQLGDDDDNPTTASASGANPLLPGGGKRGRRAAAGSGHVGASALGGGATTLQHQQLIGRRMGGDIMHALITNYAKERAFGF